MVSDATCATELGLFLDAFGILADGGYYLALMGWVLGAAEHYIKIII